MLLSPHDRCCVLVCIQVSFGLSMWCVVSCVQTSQIFTPSSWCVSSVVYTSHVFRISILESFSRIAISTSSVLLIWFHKKFVVHDECICN
ncbi:hypothetical protein KC19_VG110900 [Ceratodon purpureus]|uniref:Secreted protein n=1 Tax=Ceratodon purpureus TaxID=3225 RepID=A0A8T0HPA4_CERPU|nr:hypothetical protein KC19_VG110900 [Ceratodon purpureus]